MDLQVLCSETGDGVSLLTNGWSPGEDFRILQRRETVGFLGSSGPVGSVRVGVRSSSDEFTSVGGTFIYEPETECTDQVHSWKCGGWGHHHPKTRTFRFRV